MTIKNLATELCRKYPESPSLSLARRLYGENPELIASLEAARSAIRTARGANGKANRKIATAVREKGIPHNPLALPEPVALDFKPFVLRNAKALIISDVHIPYHDLVALTAAMQAGKKAGCDTLIILGDLMDFYQLSRFLKDPRARSVAEEINDTKQFLRVAAEMFPRVIWKYGNHDERYENYLLTKAPELLDVEGVSLPSLLKLSEMGVEVITGKRPIYAGALTLLHGHELNGGISAPVNIARGLFLRAKACAIQGHNHQTSEHSEVDVRRKLVTTWSLGCLCQLHPEYARFNKWNHGFAFLNVDGKDFEIRNRRILDGEVL
jgi:predicted phosphodiesterase